VAKRSRWSVAAATAAALASSVGFYQLWSERRPASVFQLEPGERILEVTPDAVAALIRRGARDPVAPPARDAEREARLLAEADRAADAGEHRLAADALLELLELDSDRYFKPLEERIERSLRALYPMGTSHRFDFRNHTTSFNDRMREAVEAGKADLLNIDPPMVLLHGAPHNLEPTHPCDAPDCFSPRRADLLSAEEVAELRAIHRREREAWSQTHALVCFQHDAFTGHAGMAGKWGRLLGTPGKGARGCLSQAQAQICDAMMACDAMRADVPCLAGSVARGGPGAAGQREPLLLPIAAPGARHAVGAMRTLVTFLWGDV
jgi:hypothetical protein